MLLSNHFNWAWSNERRVWDKLALGGVAEFMTRRFQAGRVVLKQSGGYVIMLLRRLLLLVSMVLVVPLFGQGVWAATRAGRSKCLDSTVQVIVETRFGTVRRASGYLFSANGQVLTAFHTISDAKNITVFHASHGVYSVDRVRRIDPRADVAVLALDRTEPAFLSSARLGDSRTVIAGDTVHVMHHSAFGVEVQYDTVVSAVGYARQFPGSFFTDHFASELLLIEVEGPWDAGSAGGLVCNDAYEVVGVLLGCGDETANGRKGYALASSYVSPLLISTYDVDWASLRTANSADADYFDMFFGQSPQLMDYYAPMPEGYIAWFAPINHVEYADYDFTLEINDKIDKNWFYSAGLKVDGRPIEEWSAAHILIWPAFINPWDAVDAVDQYVHFDADSLFSKRIYKTRDTEERIMTRYILAMALPPGEHTIQYTNKGANYKTTGMKRRRIDIDSARVTLIDIEGLSLVTMTLLPDGEIGIGEGEPVRYELERRPLQEKELNACIRKGRFQVSD